MANYDEKDLESFNVDYFKDSVALFIQKSKNEKESRYKSWEYCYNFFHSVYRKIYEKEICEPSKILNSSFGECAIDGEKWTYRDQLCLHLAFYMASWGMYRGSSFLLQNDYKIYGEVVDIIFKDEFKSLWSDETLFKTNCGDLIITLYKNIQDALSSFKEFYDTKSYFNKIGKNEKQSFYPKFLTVVSKIILGTIGCFPALDRNFKYAFGISDANNKSHFVPKTIKRVYNFVLNKKSEIESAIKEVDCMELPIMKAVDMYYFIKGQEDIFLYDLGFKKNEFKKVKKEAINEKIKQIPRDTIPTEKSKGAAKFLYNNIYSSENGSNYILNIANSNIRECIEENFSNIENFVSKCYKIEKDGGGEIKFYD